jgi:iron-sulfur cluster assembly accessory protein
MAIELTDRAAQEIKTLMTEQDKGAAALRVWVAGGGCSGLQYGMAIDDAAPEENDQIFDAKGVKVMIDALSLSYMDGASVDYVDDVLGGGFKIDNPTATGSCGCGSSFSTEEGGGGGGCGSCGSH